MSDWQFNVLFIVGVAGTVFILIAPAVGLDEIPSNPAAITGIGVILAYVLKQREKKKDDGDQGGGS